MPHSCCSCSLFPSPAQRRRFQIVPGVKTAYPTNNQSLTPTSREFPRTPVGGYIEWNAPQIKTFADGRTDTFVYSGVFDEYLQASHTNRPFEILDKYKINYAIYPPNTSLTYLLDHSPEWR